MRPAHIRQQLPRYLAIRGSSVTLQCLFCLRFPPESTLAYITGGTMQKFRFSNPIHCQSAVLIRLGRGVRPWRWTGSRGGFDPLPGVVILELRGAQVAERGVQPASVVDLDGSSGRSASGGAGEPNRREAAPLLCAGITTYNALRHSGAMPGDVVAVLGIGGLGHRTTWDRKRQVPSSPRTHSPITSALE